MGTVKDRNHQACIKMLHAEGDCFSTFSVPSSAMYTKAAFETGHADITFLRNGRGGYVECKADTRSNPLSFSLDNWNPQQRQWAEWVRKETGNEYWLFLTMGSGRVNAAQNPDRSWLVPYEAWLAMETRVRPVQATLVYRARKGMRTEIQVWELDAIHLLHPFEVQWKGGRWSVPPDHPFSLMYLQQPPQPLFRMETIEWPLLSMALSTATTTAR